jgi:hypothetical protein
MQNEIDQLVIPTNTSTASIVKTTSEEVIPSSPNFFLATYNTDHHGYHLTSFMQGNVSNLFGYFTFLNRKESFYITAVANLMKKNEFLQLNNQLIAKTITEQEFENELRLNEEKYLITTNDKFDKLDMSVVRDILPRLNGSFTTDEVADLFSVSNEKLNEMLDANTLEVIKKEDEIH